MGNKAWQAIHLAWKTTQPIPYCNAGFSFTSRIMIFESIIKQKDNKLIVWDCPSLFLCFCVESHNQKQLGKSLFQLTAYRQSLSKIRVGLQDKRPNQWRNTAYWFAPTDLFSYLFFSMLWNYLIRIGITHLFLGSPISTSKATVIEVLLGRSLPTSWSYRIIFSNVILPHQTYLELCQIGKAVSQGDRKTDEQWKPLLHQSLG